MSSLSSDQIVSACTAILLGPFVHMPFFAGVIHCAAERRPDVAEEVGRAFDEIKP